MATGKGKNSVERFVDWFAFSDKKCPVCGGKGAYLDAHNEPKLCLCGGRPFAGDFIYKSLFNEL